MMRFIGEGVDAKFVLGEEDNEISVRVDKKILEKHSPVFQELFKLGRLQNPNLIEGIEIFSVVRSIFPKI